MAGSVTLCRNNSLALNGRFGPEAAAFTRGGSVHSPHLARRPDLCDH